MKNDKYKTWIEISQAAVKKNVKSIRQIIGKNVLLMAIVKGNAYGFGVREMVNATKNIVDWYGVNDIEEANIVREISHKPILILGFITKKTIPELVQKSFSVLAYDYEMINLLSKYATKNKKAKIHLKIDTGLTRFGVLLKDLSLFSDKIKNLPNIKIEGLCTHYARLIDDNGRDIYCNQLEKYFQANEILKNKGIVADIKHTASSLASVLFEETRLDMVRIGILIYGLWGSTETKSLVKERNSKINLYPVLSFKSRVVSVKEVNVGVNAGYMNCWTAKKKTKIAVVGTGYYDGLDRRYIKSGKVLIKGEFAKIIGKIAMNTFMVEIGNIKNVKIGDEVVIIGKSKKREIKVYDIADSIGISTYEVITRINPLIPRILV